MRIVKLPTAEDSISPAKAFRIKFIVALAL